MLPTSCSQPKIDQGRNTLADHSQEIQDSSDERLWFNDSTKTLLMPKMLLPILSSFPSSLFHLGSNLHLWSYGSLSILWLPLFFFFQTQGNLMAPYPHLPCLTGILQALDSTSCCWHCSLAMSWGCKEELQAPAANGNAWHNRCPGSTC